MTGPTGPRFIFYSHDGFGLGHFRRNLVLARALREQHPHASVLLACAAEGLDTFSLPAGIDLLRLPGIRKLDNGRYAGRRLSLEAPELVTLRAGLLASAVENFHPNVLLADKHPGGVYGELVPALRLLHEVGGRAALGLRDVLDDPAETATEWSSGGLDKMVAELHDLVLVYGSQEVLNPVPPGLLPPSVARRVHFCGYVVGELPVSRSRPTDMPSGGTRPLVLATVGGGEDGLPVLKAFVAASEGARWQGVIVAGPQMLAAAWARLQATATDAGVLAYRAVPNIQRWFAHADALVCMGGYNTLLEAVGSGVPTICVPRTQPRVEQLIRARAFADMGLLQVVEPAALTKVGLARAIGMALDTPRAVVAGKVRATLDLDGSHHAAALLLELATRSGLSVRAPARVAAR